MADAASDITQLSDDQLKQLALQSMSDDDLKALHATQSPADIGTDVAKQVGSGLVQGVANLPTAVPRMLNAAGPTISSAIENVVGKVSPDTAAKMHDAEAQREAFVSNNKPSDISDVLPAPQTTAGQYARTAGEFVPGMMAAPGNLARNAVGGVTAGLSSEAAGQATEGTPYEPYVRVGAGIAGGLSGVGGAGGATASTLNPENVLAAGSRGYESPVLKNILIAPGPVQNISDNIIGQLDRARMNDRIAPQTRAIVSDLATPVGGALHSVEDYQTTRTLLGKVAGNFNNPIEQAAATQAIKSLDQQFSAIPQSQLVSGNMAAGNDVMNDARANYAAGSAADRVQTKLNNAELQAASAHSGGNIDNATRQKLRTILTSPSQSRGLTPDELDQIDQVVRGSPTGNALRATGKILGGGGGLGSLVSAAEGMHVAGPIGAAMPVAGFAVKSLGDALTRAQANRTVQQILSRAPAAANLQAPAAGLSPLAAILANANSGISNAPQIQQQLPQQQQQLQRMLRPSPQTKWLGRQLST